MKADLETFCLTCDHFKDMTWANIGIQLGFHMQMTHVEYANDVVHLHDIEQ